MKSLKIFITAITALIAMSFGLHAAVKLTIVYTNSLNGYFDDCNCKEHPKGGLVARGTELSKIRKEFANVLVFETGDFYSVDRDPILEKYLVRAYKYLNYDAFTFGDQEISAGVPEFLKNAGDLPYVSDNIRLKIDGKTVKEFERFRIIQKYGIKAGVIGTIAADAFKYYPKKVTDDVEILDQIAEIGKDVSTLKEKKVDIIILLSHSGYDQDRIIAQSIKGIDLIVGGHSQTLMKTPEKAGNTIIVQAGTNGANIGILELSLAGKISIIKNTFRLPHLKITPEDKEIRKMINEYRAEVKESNKDLKFK
ncbi:MAG: hypothetical protein MUC95_02025 [Spirochaetes bacterium]|nr:hypothetical protein [Spirochaetota bacterium]